MFGVFLDVTPRKQAEETREMLAAEISHRVKNLFAIAAALTAIAAHSAATMTEMARDLTQRLTALGRAHDLVRPMPGQEERRAAPLRDLLAALLAPYDDRGAVGDRIHVSVPEMRVGETSAQRSPWWSTSWRPTRSSLARFRSRAARSTCRASTPTIIW